MHISISQIAQFKRSPRAWFLRHILHLPTGDLEVFHEGLALHSFLESVVTGHPISQEITQSLGLCFPYVFSDNFIETFRHSISEYSFNISDPITHTNLVGRIDSHRRISEFELAISDFKYSSKTPKELVKTTLFQLKFYAYILSLSMPEILTFSLYCIAFSKNRKANPRIDVQTYSREEVHEFYISECVPIILDMINLKKTQLLPSCDGLCCHTEGNSQTTFFGLCNGITPKTYRKYFFYLKQVLGRRPYVHELNHVLIDRKLIRLLKQDIQENKHSLLTKIRNCDIITDGSQQQEDTIMSEIPFIRLVTPELESIFSHVVEEDSMSNRFSLTFKLDPTNPEHLKVIEKINDFVLTTSKGKDNFKPFNWKTDKDKEGNPTGKVLLQAKTTFKPKVVDMNSNDVWLECEMRPGTIVKAQLTLKEYLSGPSRGVATYLNAVQIVSVPEKVERKQTVDLDKGDVA